MTELYEKTCPLKLNEADSLFFKFQGDGEAIDLASKTVSEVIKKHGGEDLVFSRSEEEGNDIWHARKTVRICPSRSRARVVPI